MEENEVRQELRKSIEFKVEKCHCRPGMRQVSIAGLEEQEEEKRLS